MTTKSRSEWSREWWPYTFYLREAIEGVLAALRDWKLLDNDASVNESLAAAGLTMVRRVYTGYIIVEMQKIFSDKKTEQIRLKRVKDFIKNLGIDEPDIEKAIDLIYEDNKKLLDKLLCNRHQIFAHLDVDKAPGYGLSSHAANIRAESLPHQYSQTQRERLRKSFLPADADKEHYTKEDISHELPILQGLLEELIPLLDRMNDRVYTLDFGR